VSRAFLHSHSYTGNPLACRAALVTLDIFDQDDVLSKNRERAKKFGEALARVAGRSNVRNARQTGMICAFDVTPEVAEGFSRRFFAEALKLGVLLRPIGATVYWMPPFIVSDEEIALLSDVTLAVLNKVAGVSELSPE
ncbi:MAG: aminotransferase class III-fold pyridoxal phosphate-dependent enzyme, partial [Betaproteobacteria bacterium]